MAVPTNADVVIVRGFWIDEITGQGVRAANGTSPATITFDPVPLTGASTTITPNLRDAAYSSFVKTRQRVATVDLTSGYFAALLVANNDPDLDAYGGRRVTMLGETPFVIEVPHNASTVTVDAATATATGLLQGSTAKAIWLVDAALVTTPAPQPTNSYLTSAQTLSTIASGIEAHDEDSTAHADLRGLIGALTQSATKTANYTAAANEVVPLDTSGGTFTLTGPTNGGRFGARWKAGTTAPTIAAPSGYTINGAASISMGLAAGASSGEFITWQAFGTDYQAVGGFKPQSALDSRYQRPKALAKLYAGLAARQASPCRIVFVGSSTTQGLNATTAERRYVDQLVARMQRAFPSGLGSESSVVASLSADFGTLSTAAGVHGYNAGEGGTTTENYLTDTEIGKIGALDARAVFHMVGTNDAAADIVPSTYKANIKARIASIRSLTPGPQVHVLVHTFPRFDAATPLYPWVQYGNALREVAAEDPDNVVMIDLTGPYEQVGIPSGLTRTVAAGGILVSDPLKRTESPLGNADTGQRWVLDGTWASTSAGAASTSNGAAYIDVANGDHDVTATVNISGTPGSTAGIGIAFNVSDYNNRLTFILNVNASTWILAKFNASSTSTTLQSGTGVTTTSGASHVLRAVSSGSTITCYIDGTQVTTYTLDAGETTKYKAYTKVGFRHNVTVPGTVTDFKAVAISTTTLTVVDPLNLVGLDNIHQTDAGHAFMSTQVAREIELGGGAPDSSALNTKLLQWGYAQTFRLVSATRDANEAITTASVVWPDGATGTLTTDTASTTFPGAIDAYHITYVPASGATKTITQPAVTRDAAGAVTAQPALTVA